MQYSFFPKRILIAGASGMVGAHLLDICIQSEEIETIFMLSRKPSANLHKKDSEEPAHAFLHKFFLHQILGNLYCIGCRTFA